MFLQSRRVELLIGTILLSLATTIRAEEKPAAEAFVAVHTRWRALDNQLTAVVNEFSKATDERKKELREEYSKLRG